MKLKDARLCIECEEVFDPKGETFRLHGIDLAICPSCGNSTSLLLSRILNSRDPEPTVTTTNEVTHG
ncbi:MAG: hypothetical protein ACUVWN_04605 [bacterium]